MSTNSRLRRSLNKKLMWWVTILAGVATIVTLAVTLIDRPKPFTIGDWVARANSTCDRDARNAQASAGDISRDEQKVRQEMSYGVLLQTDEAKLADDVASFTGIERELNADLADIPKPNSRDGEVRRALDAGNKAYIGMSKAVSALEIADSNNIFSVQNALNQMDVSFWHNPYYPKIHQALQGLGVSHCYD